MTEATALFNRKPDEADSPMGARDPMDGHGLGVSH